MSDPFGLADLPDPLPIEPVGGPLEATAVVPGSKSVTNRALVCAALATGTSQLDGALFADDTEAMLGVLAALGIDHTTDVERATIEITGCAGAVPETSEAIDTRQSGTTSRFTLPLLALGSGAYRVTAHPQMQARPMGTTFEALAELGAGIEALGEAGHLPATITAGGRRTSVLQIAGDASSQFLSGLLMFGKTKEDARLMQNQFRQRKPERQYDALVAGVVGPDRGEFRSYLATGRNLTRYSTDDEEDGQLAVTHYQVTERLPDTTHVSIQLETGRRNQIRVHFAEAQHPVLGDNRYRKDLWKHIPWAHKRFALHASTLGFNHPITGESMRFSSPLPVEMTKFMSFSKRLDKVLQNEPRVQGTPRSAAGGSKASDRNRKRR